ncbi:polypeptide N-acetylgalactosaminyltransferase 15 isoform X2 [Mixophyes fleayi]|uniref:polypeptide N-acetylgalactosaminyltransferase 15 isoform X2 n=1 Tax=Mixophyes fleayi TaxID=3061075 RepID=UPI003F4E33C7
MLLRKRCRSLLCQLQILVLMLALVLLLVMVAMLDPEVQSEDNAIYLHQHHAGEQDQAGVGSLMDQAEETNQYKVEILSPLSSLRDEELIAIGMSGHRRRLDKVRRNMYRIVKQSKRKSEDNIVTQIGHTEQPMKTHWFNEAGSQKIPLHRAIPEGRHALCLQQIYNENFPTTSVIISFHNEAWSTLLRTVHSVLDNSPKKILKEIILVDDLSHQGHLKSALSEYVSRIAGVKLIRSNKRLGVIGGRMLGAARATGEILVFMDPHCECHPGWLEPLLSRLMNNRNRIVSPVLDVIDWRTFDYYHTAELRQGVFDWKLDFHWVTLPEREEKIWLCGGSVEIVPCSRVGHMFHNQTTYSTLQNDAILKNKIRIAEVWMDSYKNIFYHNSGKELLSNLIETTDVKEREQLRLTLGCKGFQWFLANIYPDIFSSFSALESSGQFFNSGVGNCVQCTYKRRIHLVELSNCSDQMNQQFVYHNKKIRLRATDSLCLDAGYEQIVLRNCTLNDVSTWDFSGAGLIVHLSTGKCLEPGTIQNGNTFLFLKPCNNGQRSQMWKMIPM